MHEIDKEDEKFNNLLMKFSSAIRKKCRKYAKSSSFYSEEDLFQIGSMVLWDLYKKYDKSVGVKFPTYFFICLERSLLKEVRKLKKKEIRKEYKDMIKRQNPLNRQFLDIDLKEELDFHLSKISSFDRAVFKLRSDGLTFDQIGEQLFISRDKAFNTNKIISKKLKHLDSW